MKNKILFLVSISFCLKAQPPIGLYNVGNTCYQNAVLQNFFNIPALTKFMLENKDTDFFIKNDKEKKTISAAYTDLVEQVNHSSQSLNPQSFCVRAWDIAGLTPRQQADPSSFIQPFLDHLIDKDINLDKKKDKYGYPFFYSGPSFLFKTPLSDLFTVRRIDLMGLNNSYTNLNEVVDFDEVGNMQEIFNENIKLRDLAQFPDENLDALAVNAPPYLLFRLVTDVYFPLKLDWPFLHMGEYEEKAVYDLIGVVEYIENVKHYIAYIKTVNGQWFEVNDSISRQVEVDQEFINKKKIKILFYRRETAEPAKKITPKELEKAIKNKGISDEGLKNFLENRSKEYGFAITLQDLVNGINYGANTEKHLLHELSEFRQPIDLKALKEQFLWLEVELSSLANAI